MELTFAVMLALAPTAPPSPSRAVIPVAAPAAKLSLADPGALVSFLQSEGYRAKLLTGKGNPSIESSAAGARFYIDFQSCKEGICQSVMFRSSYEKDSKAPANLETINAFNRESRWVRAYLDKEGDPAIEMDVLFHDRQIDRASFGDALAIWSDLLGEFHRAIGW